MERVWFKVSKSSDCDKILQDEGGEGRSMVLWQQCVKRGVRHEGGEHGVMLLYGHAWDVLPGARAFQGSTQWKS